MSQRYFGRPLAGEGPPDLALALSAMVATAGGVLQAAAIDPDVLGADTWRSVAGLLLAPALTTLVFGALGGRRLLRLIRRSDAAGSVAPPAGPAQRRQADGSRRRCGASSWAGSSSAPPSSASRRSPSSSAR